MLVQRLRQRHVAPAGSLPDRGLLQRRHRNWHDEVLPPAAVLRVFPQRLAHESRGVPHFVAFFRKLHHNLRHPIRIRPAKHHHCALIDLRLRHAVAGKCGLHRSSVGLHGASSFVESGAKGGVEEATEGADDGRTSAGSAAFRMLAQRLHHEGRRVPNLATLRRQLADELRRARGISGAQRGHRAVVEFVEETMLRERRLQQVVPLLRPAELGMITKRLEDERGRVAHLAPLHRQLEQQFGHAGRIRRTQAGYGAFVEHRGLEAMTSKRLLDEAILCSIGLDGLERCRALLDPTELRVLPQRLRYERRRVAHRLSLLCQLADDLLRAERVRSIQRGHGALVDSCGQQSILGEGAVDVAVTRTTRRRIPRFPRRGHSLSPAAKLWMIPYSLRHKG
mmetsp:Transcript_57597/g.160440  ORF Transcript_57597/g.160440 Transcript_57597/m.160440 type:complete len:394 (+) Transcript_57597:751-1932(+)